jgi:hypothetical protein
MAFVSEVASEEDITRYGLNQLIKRFNPLDGPRTPGLGPAWTIDRERGMYLMTVKSIREDGPSGLPEPTPKRICVLNCEGKQALFTLERDWKTGSRSFVDSPFRVVWSLIDIDMSEMKDVPSEQAVVWLKEALTAYGHAGPLRQPPHTVVSFNF